MEKLTEQERRLLEGLPVETPDSLMDNLKLEIGDLEKRLAASQGKQELLAGQEQDIEVRKCGITGSWAETYNKLLQYQQRLGEGLDYTALQAESDTLSARLNERKTAALAPTDTSELDKQIGDLEQRVMLFKCVPYISNYTAAIEVSKTQLIEVRNSYDRAALLKTSVQPGMQCPTCQSVLQPQSVIAFQAWQDSEMQRFLEKGQNLNAQYIQLVTGDQTEKADFDSARKVDLEKLNLELDALKKQRGAQMTEWEAGLQALQRGETRLQELKRLLTFGNLTDEEYRDMSAQKQTYDGLKKELDLLGAADFGLQREKEAALAVQLEQSLNAKKEQRAAFEEFLAKRLQLSCQGLNLPNVAIVLNRTLKSTQEYTNTFDFSYQGRNYGCLSNSEKTLAGMELVELFQRLTGKSYPVIVDNAEGIGGLAQPAGQAVLCYRVPDSPLIVNGVELKNTVYPRTEKGPALRQAG